MYKEHIRTDHRSFLTREYSWAMNELSLWGKMSEGTSCKA